MSDMEDQPHTRRRRREPKKRNPNLSRNPKLNHNPNRSRKHSQWTSSPRPPMLPSQQQSAGSLLRASLCRLAPSGKRLSRSATVRRAG